MIIEGSLTVVILSIGLWLGIGLPARGNFRRVVGMVSRCLFIGHASCFEFLQNFPFHFALVVISLQ